MRFSIEIPDELLAQKAGDNSPVNAEPLGASLYAKTGAFSGGAAPDASRLSLNSIAESNDPVTIATSAGAALMEESDSPSMANALDGGSGPKS